MINALKSIHLILLLLISVFSVEFSAHHPFSDNYNKDNPVTLKGKVTGLDWESPHVWIYLSVIGTDGAYQSWKVQSARPAVLLRKGLSEDYLQDMEITIFGYQSRNLECNPYCTAYGQDLTDGGGRIILIGE